MKLPLSEKEARFLVRRETLRVASLLWTYAWELDRRARRKGKGTVSHRIWRAIPKEERKRLNGGQVWEAREQLLSTVREFHNSRVA